MRSMQLVLPSGGVMGDEEDESCCYGSSVMILLDRYVCCSLSAYLCVLIGIVTDVHNLEVE